MARVTGRSKHEGDKSWRRIPEVNLFGNFIVYQLAKKHSCRGLMRCRGILIVSLTKKLTVEAPGREVNLPGKMKLIFYLTSVVGIG
ncbi:MAG: hypothetical protein AB2L20_09765 [Mangrovibacterium sp.]